MRFEIYDEDISLIILVTIDQAILRRDKDDLLRLCQYDWGPIGCASSVAIKVTTNGRKFDYFRRFFRPEVEMRALISAGVSRRRCFSNKRDARAITVDGRHARIPIVED